MAVDPSYGLLLLQEVIEDSGFVDVVKLQPPDGMVIRDISGSVFGVSVYQQEEQR